MVELNPPVILPYPDSRLSPNARLNRYALNEVKQQARQIGFTAVKQSGVYIHDAPVQLFVKIFPPDNRRRDDDNILASLKSYRDGMFDALGIDDNRVKLTTFGVGKVTQGGAVYIWIEPLAEMPDWMKKAAPLLVVVSRSCIGL